MKQLSSLEQVITAIETYCTKNALDHRFVGGVSFGGLLNEKTTAEIAIDEKTIKLKQHNKETTLRQDKTIRDIDLIFFCKDKKKIIKFVKFITKLRVTHKTRNFPDISFEPTIYPSFGKRQLFSQFVTALEVDEKNNLYLAFDTIKQKITWDSVEPWKVILENGLAFTVRNPIADYYAYLFRSPAGPKPKDIKKIQYLKQLTTKMIELGKEHQPKTDYEANSYYGAWEKYIEKLQKTEDPLINAKKVWLGIYWQTIGTPLAHTLARYGNNFTGIKQ